MKIPKVRKRAISCMIDPNENISELQNLKKKK
jgi:hypothetical protein